MMSQSYEYKISDLTIFLAKYFLVFFYALLITDVLNIYHLTLQSSLFKYAFIGLSMYLLFFLSDTLYSLIIRRKPLLKKIALDSLFDVTFVIPIILIIKNKRTNGRVLAPDTVFLLGGSLFLIMFLSAFIFSIAFGLSLARFGLNLFLLNEVNNSSSVPPVTHLSNSEISVLIIVNNTIFVLEIFLGSFFLLTLTFKTILSDSIIGAPLVVYLINTGHTNGVLPQLLLELLGTYVATAASFTNFYAFFMSFKKEKDLEYLRRQMYAIRLIIFGLILSIYAFLVGWQIEDSLFNPINNNPLWYRTIYLFDVITIIIYAGFLYDILKRKVFPVFWLVVSSLASSMILFTALAGGPTAIKNSIPLLMLLAIASLLYPLGELRNVFLGDKTLKKLSDSLRKLGCRFEPGAGRSMLPTIKPGEYLIVKVINDKSELQVGDIIVFDSPIYYNPFGGFVAHRIIKLGKNKVRTKGDNNKRPDPPIKYHQVLGIIIGKCDQSFTVCEPLINRPELIKIFREAETLIRKEASKIDKRVMKIKSVGSIIFVIAIAFFLPFLFLIVY